MATNYYLVLGVAPDANLAQIKRAYRTLTHRYHPDRSGGEEQQFLRLKEAYDALSDPLERQRHDQQIERPQPVAPRPRSVAASPIDLFADFATYTPSAEEILHTFIQNFTGRGIPKSQPQRQLNIEIVLSPQEAAQGGHLPLRLPLLEPCAQCAGTGRDGYYRCDACDGQGTFQRPGQVDVLIPRHVADGTIIPVSLRHLGIHNLYLNVHLRVAPPRYA